jgi:hypothetical protein
MKQEEKEWRPYLNDRLINRHESDFYVIIPNNVSKHVPLSCPVCDTLLRSIDDENSYNEYECCDACARKWAMARKVEWSNGWRPLDKDVQDDVSNRPPIVFTINVD